MGRPIVVSRLEPLVTYPTVPLSNILLVWNVFASWAIQLPCALLSLHSVVSRQVDIVHDRLNVLVDVGIPLFRYPLTLEVVKQSDVGVLEVLPEYLASAKRGHLDVHKVIFQKPDNVAYLPRVYWSGRVEELTDNVRSLLPSLKLCQAHQSMGPRKVGVVVFVFFLELF